MFGVKNNSSTLFGVENNSPLYRYNLGLFVCFFSEVGIQIVAGMI